MPIDVIVADYGICTALGPDTATSWERLQSGACAITSNTRLLGRLPGVPWPSAVCPGVEYSRASLVMQALSPLLAPVGKRVPANALLLLATTVGEIDLLERAYVQGSGCEDAGRLDGTLECVSRLLGLSRRGCVVSCACASSSMAMAVGASLIRAGRETDVVVVGCDAVSEFVVAGFAALAALSTEPARPFDRLRQGLSLGEGAGWCWLRGTPADGRSQEAGRGRLLGWSCRADAYHMTAPDPQGGGLVAAIEDALRMAGMDASELGAVCAHGTGTRYNDDMEANAFARVSASAEPIPVFSVKGSIGHTLGAAGIVEAVFALEASRNGLVPPTTGCCEPDPPGTAVTRECIQVGRRPILSTNSGFGGVNTSLILDGHPAPKVHVYGPRSAETGRAVLSGLVWATQSELLTVGAASSARLPLPSMNKPDAFFRGGYRNWGRVSPLARRLAFALETGFRELRVGENGGNASSWGLLGVNRTGCPSENAAFFRDYLDNGRSLARGALFVQTLPSTPVAEASIHFALHGPVCHFVDPDLDFSRAVDWGCATIACGGTDGLVVASLEGDQVLCAYLRAASSSEAAADMGWADEVARAMPHAAPREWMVRFGGTVQGSGNRQ